MPNSTAFQVVIDRAESISVQRRHVTAQTSTRNGVVRTVSRGAYPKKFIVTLPNGIPWTELRELILAMDTADRFTVADLVFSDTGYSPWLGDTAAGGFYGNTYTVTCTHLPNWIISARNQVSWDSAFEFTEYVA